MSKKKIIWCNQCNTGEGVHTTLTFGTLVWDIDNQDWVLNDVDGEPPRCGYCDSSAHVEWKED